MPKDTFQRRKLKSRCGSRAFLMPRELKYPIMSYRAGCVPDCAGILSAYKRALQVASTTRRAAATVRGRERNKLLAKARKLDRLARKARSVAADAACQWEHR